MSKLKFLIDDEEEEKEKTGWLQRTRGIGELPEEPISTKLKFTVGLGLGIGTKATGGVSLPEITPVTKPLIEGLPMSKPEEKPDPTWGNIIKYSLKSGLAQYQSSLVNVLRLIDMGIIKLTDPINTLIPETEQGIKFKEKFGKDPDWGTTSSLLNKIVEDSEKIATKSAEQAESKNWLKKLVSTGLQSAPQIIGAGILGAGMPVVGGIAAAKPIAEIATRLTQMIPFGVGATGAHARDIEKEYESLGKEAPYLAMVAGGLLGGVGEMATELPVFLGVTKLLKVGGKALINEGAKNLIGKYGKLGVEFIKDLALQSWQEAEMEPIEKAIKQAVGLPQDWSIKPLVKQMGQAAYGGLAMALVLGGLGGSAVGSVYITNKTMEAVDNVIKNKGDIKEAIRKVAETQGIILAEPKAVALGYEKKEEIPKAEVKEPIPDEIDKKIRNILDKDKELLAITKEYNKTTKPYIWGSGDKSLLKKEADLYTEKYNKLLKEELKAKGKEPTIPKELNLLAEETKKYKTEEEWEKAIYDSKLKTIPKAPVPYNQMGSVVELTKSAGFKSIEDFYNQVTKVEPKIPITPELPKAEELKKVESTVEPTPKTIPKELDQKIKDNITDPNQLFTNEYKYGDKVNLFTDKEISEIQGGFINLLEGFANKWSQLTGEEWVSVHVSGVTGKDLGDVIVKKSYLKENNLSEDRINIRDVPRESLINSNIVEHYEISQAIIDNAKSQNKAVGLKAEGKAEATIPATEKPAVIEPEKVTTEPEVVKEKVKEEVPIKSPIPPSPLTKEMAKEPIGDPIAKLNELIKQAKPLRGRLETEYTKERARRIAEVERAIDEIGGEQGYIVALSKLKGKLGETKGAFEPVEDKLTKPELDDLYDRTFKHPFLDEWEKISAANELTNLLSGELPTPKGLVLLEEIYGTNLIKSILSKRALGFKIADVLIDIANIPRAILATADMSGFLRQGVVYDVSHPVIAAKAMGKTFQFAFSPKAFEQYFKDLPKDKLYPLMRKSGLAMTDPSRALATGREEAFISRLMQKIPIIGQIIKFSERSYVGFLTKLRVDVFKTFADEFLSKGYSPVKDRNLFKSTAEVVNTFTGRGNLGSLNRITPLLNTTFFSPRLIMARFNALNPLWYARQPKQIRVKALGDFAKFVAAGVTLLVLIKASGLADVEPDPRSSDFGKIKTGNTRRDIWGGFQQWCRVFAQLITGERKNTATGEIISLSKEEYPFTTRKEVLLRFIEGKLAPVPALINELISGAKTFEGEDITFETVVREKFIPMYIQDIAEAYADGGFGRAVEVGPEAFAGIGVQTWEEKKSKESTPSFLNKYKPTQIPIESSSFLKKYKND